MKKGLKSVKIGHFMGKEKPRKPLFIKALRGMYVTRFELATF